MPPSRVDIKTGLARRRTLLAGNDLSTCVVYGGVAERSLTPAGKPTVSVEQPRYSLKPTAAVTWIFPRFDVAEQDAMRTVQRRQAVVLSNRVTFGQMLADLTCPLPGVDAEEPRYAPTPVALLALAESIQTLPDDAHYAPLKQDRAFLRRVAALIDACKEGRVPPLELVPDPVGGGARGNVNADTSRLHELGEIYRRYQELLDDANLYDDGDRVDAALRRIAAADPLPHYLRSSDRVEFVGFLDPTPGRIAIIEALADRLARSAGRAIVTVELPYDPDLRTLTGCVETVVRRFEERPTSSLDLRFLNDTAPPSAAARVVAAAWTGANLDPEAANAVVLMHAANEREEQVAIAREVRTLLLDGVSIDDIVVAQRSLDAPPPDLCRALEAMGIPWHFRRGESLVTTPLFRLIVRTFRASERGLPRVYLEEAMLAAYCDVAALSPAERVVAVELLRASGYISDTVDRATMGLRASLQRVLDLIEPVDLRSSLKRFARLESAVARALPMSDDMTPVHGFLSRVRDVLIGIMELAQALALAPTIAAWATAATQLLDTLGIVRGAQLVPAEDVLGSAPAPARVRLARALSRDHQTIRHVLLLLSDMQSFGATWTLKSTAGERDYCDWFEELADGLNLNPKGARGGALRLMPIRELAFAKYDHVFLMGAVDGALPRRFRPDLLLTDRERARLNRERALRGRLPAFLLHEKLDDEPDAALRQDWEPLLFYLAARAAAVSFTISHAKADHRGKPLLASSYIDQLRSLQSVRELEVNLEPIPELHHCATAEDLTMRAMFELSRSGAVLSPPGGGWGAVAAEVSTAGRGAPLMVRAQAEMARIALQLSGDPMTLPDQLRPHGPYLGFLSPRVAARVSEHPRARFDADNPVSPTRLDRLGGNPGQGLFQDIIQVRGYEPPQLTPSAARIGSLVHEVLERTFRALGHEGLLPLPSPTHEDFVRARGVLLGIADRVFETMERSEHVGIPLVWAQHKKDLIGHLESFLVTDASRQQHAKERPARVAVEVPFGYSSSHPDAIERVALPWDDEIFYLCGFIDRMDISADGAVNVFDYKTSRNSRTLKNKLSADALAQTDHQLLAYMAAARAHAEHRAGVRAAYIAINGEANPYVQRHRDSGRGNGTPAIRSDTPASAYVGDRYPELDSNAMLYDLLAFRVAQIRRAIRAGAFPTTERPAFGPFRAIARVRERMGDA